uniref:Uncharacterized protein n=1 Tax=Anguilla anguilla TaxID=7936 RepID=A0A0E9SP78_ANGAN
MKYLFNHLPIYN